MENENKFRGQSCPQKGLIFGQGDSMIESFSDFLEEILNKGGEARTDLLFNGFKLYFQGVARRLLPGGAGQREIYHKVR